MRDGRRCQECLFPGKPATWISLPDGLWSFCDEHKPKPTTFKMRRVEPDESVAGGKAFCLAYCAGFWWAKWRAK